MTEYYINAWEEFVELHHMSMAQLHETITSLDNLKAEHSLRKDAISNIGCSPTYYDACVSHLPSDSQGFLCPGSSVSALNIINFLLKNVQLFTYRVKNPFPRNLLPLRHECPKKQISMGA